MARVFLRMFYGFPVIVFCTCYVFSVWQGEKVLRYFRSMNWCRSFSVWETLDTWAPYENEA